MNVFAKAAPRLRHLAVLLLLAVFPAQAVIVDNLYRGLVPVEDHSNSQLQRATRQGLAQVLVKVSGDGSVLEYAAVRQALGQSSIYMQRYRYLREDDGIRMEVFFDPTLVNELLRDARAPLWTANRPPVLVWLVAEDAGGRHPVTRESNPELMNAITEQLERRGVPAVFPLYDLTDTLAISIHDLWRMDKIAIDRASQRYDVENVLAGRMTVLPDDRWMGDWLYLFEQDSAADSFYGEPLAEVSAGAVDLVADRMSARYAVAAGAGGGEAVLVRVDAIPDYREYRRVLDYLEGIELVDAAWPAYIEGESVVFRLSAQADAEQLHRIIGLSRSLERLDAPQPLERGPVDLSLTYVWLP